MSYVNSCLCCYAYAFFLRTSKDSSVGEFEESIINSFNIIFSFVLFTFKFILFKYYFLLYIFYFNCIFIFQERIFGRFSLGAKERGLWADSGWKNTRFNAKIYFPKPEVGTARVKSHTVVPHLRISLLLLLLLVQATY